MQKVHSVPTRTQSRWSHVSRDLTSGTHVFVRNHTVRKPLQQPYDGPYKALAHTDKINISPLMSMAGVTPFPLTASNQLSWMKYLNQSQTHLYPPLPPSFQLLVQE